MTLPLGGLTIFFHLLVLTVYKQAKILLSSLIILALFVSAGIGVVKIAKFGAGSLSNYQFLADQKATCRPITTKSSLNHIVLRTDDVQAFTWQEVTQKIITDAQIRGSHHRLHAVPLDRGVIGGQREQCMQAAALACGGVLIQALVHRQQTCQLGDAADVAESDGTERSGNRQGVHADAALAQSFEGRRHERRSP